MSKKPSKTAPKLINLAPMVPIAAPSSTPQLAEARETRSSRSKPEDPNPAVSYSTTTEPHPGPFTRSHKEMEAQIKEAQKIVNEQLEKIRQLVKVVPSNQSTQNPQASHGKPGKTSVDRDVVKEIDDFYTEFTKDEQFKATRLKVDVRSESQGELPLDRAGFVDFIQKDFVTGLKSSGDDIADIIQGGMSLTHSEEGGDVEGGDPDNDFAKELEDTFSHVGKIFTDVKDLLLNKIVSRSFSTIRKKDYRRLGVNEKKPVPAIPLCSKVLDDIAFGGVVEAEFGQDWENVLEEMKVRMVETINNFWNILSEESTRLIINDLKYCLISAKVVYVNLHDSQIVCYPELSLGSHPRSQARDSIVRAGTAVTIENQHGHKTRLSGSTDYFTFYTTNIASVMAFKEERSRWRGSATQLYADVIEQWTSEAFAIVEAKSPLTRLETHIPQVVAEAIALGRKKQKSHVPFCLTSGMFWIFGVLHEVDNKRTFWRTTTIPFKPTRGGILLILAMMFSWVSVNPLDLWKLGSENREGKKR